MRNARHQAAHRSWRHALLAGAAAVALGMGAPAVAQQQGGQQQAQGQANQAPSQQPGSAQPAVAGQLRTAEQSLRQAHGQIPGDQQPNFAQARTAVSAGQEVLGRVPQQVQGQDAYQNTRRQLEEGAEAARPLLRQLLLHHVQNHAAGEQREQRIHRRARQFDDRPSRQPASTAPASTQRAVRS